MAKDIPLWEPPPPLPLPPAVPGPRQRKTKTWAEETAAGAPPEKPGQKARASRPRCPAAGGLAPLPGSVPLALAARSASQPLTTFLIPVLCPGQLPLQPPSQPPADVPCGRASRCPRRVPQAVPTERGRRDPGPAATSPASPGSAPFPGSAPSPWGAGAPGEAGSRPGRKRLHSSGGRGGSVARALLGAPAGTREGRGRWAGSNAEGGASLRSSPCAPDRAHPLPLAGLHTDAYGRAEVGVGADSQRERDGLRETVWAGLAQKRR